MLSLVVSVMEENLSRLKAIDKASEFMKGQRLQGCALMTLTMFASVAIYLTFFILPANQVKFVGLTMKLAKIYTFCLMKLSSFVVSPYSTINTKGAS